MFAGKTLAAEERCASSLTVTTRSIGTSRFDRNHVRLTRITVDPSRLDAFLESASQVGRDSIQKEPGVRVLYSVRSKARPNEITILEIYESEAAYRAHIQSEHFQKFKRDTAELVRTLELIDCVPLVPEAFIKP